MHELQLAEPLNVLNLSGRGITSIEPGGLSCYVIQSVSVPREVARASEAEVLKMLKCVSLYLPSRGSPLAPAVGPGRADPPRLADRRPPAPFALFQGP